MGKLLPGLILFLYKFSAMKSQRQTILLVDDDENDRFLTQKALQQLDIGCVVQGVTSGDEAIAYLKGLGPFHERSRYQFPGYIITDLNMPDGDGFDLLNFLKDNPQLSIVPVVVFSSSSDADDIRQAYALGASAFLVKHQDPKVRVAQLKKLYEFFSECEVPEVAASGHAMATQSRGKSDERFSPSILTHPTLDPSPQTKTLTRPIHRRAARPSESHAPGLSVFRHQTASQ